MIYNDPNFKGVGGQFDPARFQATIRQFGYTEQRYLAEQRRVSLRRQIAGTVSAGLEPPKAADRGADPLPERAALDRLRQARRRAGRHHRSALARNAGRLFRRSQDPVPRARIPQTVLRRDHAGRDRQMERGLRRRRAGRSSTQRKDKLGTPEKREVSQIVFPEHGGSAGRARRIASGTSFEDLAKERGLNPSDFDLGLIAKSAIIDPAAADAAFSLPRARSASRCRAGSAWPSSRSARSSPAPKPTYESVAATVKKEIAARTRAPRSPSSTTRWKTSAAAAPAWSKPRRSSG